AGGSWCVPVSGASRGVYEGEEDGTVEVNRYIYKEKEIYYDDYPCRNNWSDPIDDCGFNHFCDRTRKGAFKVGRRTARNKFTRKIQEMNKWLKYVRNTAKPAEWWSILSAKLRGHFQYYGVSGNYRGIMRYYTLTIKLIYKWLNRRSQKNSFNWKEFNKYLQRHPLPTPRIHHNFYTWGY
ncbi:MAG: strong similarity to group II intron-encoded protein LtrA, partial [Candidatus Scalindua rubra]